MGDIHDTDFDERLRWQLRALRSDAPPQRDLWPGIAARMRAKQVQTSHAKPTQCRFGCLEPGYDFIATHTFNITRHNRLFHCRLTGLPT